MKKATTKHCEPSRASLREMPPLVLDAYQVRRNPYAARIRREGVELVHDGPSKRSLAEVPEADFEHARVRRNKYSSRAAESAAAIQYGRGRPAAGHERGATLPPIIATPGRDLGGARGRGTAAQDHGSCPAPRDCRSPYPASRPGLAA